MYSDDNYCNTITARRGKKAENFALNYSMFADKQNFLLNFSSTSPPEGTLKINVFDAQGKLVQSSIIETPNSFFKINFTHPSNQFYLISLIDNTNFHQQNFKLVW